MTENACFRAVTRYDETACSALAYLMIHKLRKTPRIMLIIVGMLTAFGSAALMLYGGSITPLGLLMMMLGSMLCIFGVLAQRFAVKMMTANHKKNGIPENTYLFYEDRLRIQAKDQHRDYRYADLTRVLEMSGYLFLFTRDQQLYLLGLKDVKGGQKKFRAFLEDHIMQARAGKENNHVR